MTGTETSGRAAPAAIARLPAKLRDECGDLAAVYRDLGYTDTEPFPVQSPVPMVYLRRPVRPADVRL